MHKKRSRLSQSPVRVRQEPPTVAEAVAAAQALTPDLEQQVDITAGLMGLTPDEARPFVLEAPPLTLQRPAAPQRGYTGTPGPALWASLVRLRRSPRLRWNCSRTKPRANTRPTASFGRSLVIPVRLMSSTAAS